MSFSLPLRVLPRVHKKEKRVSNCTIPAYKHSFRSTKYTCVCLVLHSDLLLSKQLYKSIVDDLRTSKKVFGQLDTLLFFLYTLGITNNTCWPLELADAQILA